MRRELFFRFNPSFTNTPYTLYEYTPALPASKVICFRRTETDIRDYVNANYPGESVEERP